jgi:hypothetical protein
MSKFMLLLHQDPAASARKNPEALKQRADKYMAWGTQPFVVDGKRLGDDTGRVIRNQNGGPKMIDGPYSETKEVLAGYYTIEAQNYDEAVRIASTNPHLEYGGTIEVRQVYGT